MLSVRWANHEFELLPERALWWPARGTLIAADLHLGKPAAFRAAGVPVPESVTEHDLHRLSRLIDRLGPERLVVLGDLLHAPQGMSPETIARVAAWRAGYRALDMVLVRGNHDVRSGPSPRSWTIAEHGPPLIEDGVALVHEPLEIQGFPVLAGHLHPCVRLDGGGGGPVRAPCFWLTERVGVLPAFGTFTGGARVRPRPGDRVFVVGPGCVVEVAGRPGDSRRAAAARRSSRTR